MLNISKFIYAGYDPKTKLEKSLPEAEIVPIGETTSEKSKIKTLTNSFPTIKELENKPLPGFTLYDCNRKKFGAMDQTWLVIDPRGFTVRISNENLNYILRISGITEGLIQEQCVWARDNSQTKMMLIPINSPDYSTAVQNTELLEQKVNFKEVSIGDTVLLQNELVGEFMGIVSLYGPGHQFDNHIKPRVRLRRQVIRIAPNKYFYQTDLKILKILKKSEQPMTREKAILLMNDEIKTGLAYFTAYKDTSRGTYYGSWDAIVHVSSHAISKVLIELEEISQDETFVIFDKAKLYQDQLQLAFEDASGDKFLIEFPYHYFSSKPPLTKLDVFETIKILGISAEKDRIHLEDFMSVVSRPIKTFNIGNCTKYYKIVKKIKNETYI